MEKKKCGWVNEQSNAASYTTRETDVKCNMENAGERIRGKAAAAAACVLWACPCVRSAAVRHGPGCSGRRRRGARDSAYSEAPGRHVSRAASLRSPPGPSRFGSRLTRSLHLLPLAVLQPVRNDAVSGPLPPFTPGRDTEQGAGRRMESARGEEGRIRRLHPEAPPAGSAGRRRCQLHPGARGEGASALPRPQFLAGLCRSGRPSPRQCVGAPGLSLSCEPKLCNLSGIGSFPKEKQIVTNALGARASFSLPELSAFFPGLRHPNAVLPKPVRRAPRLPLPPLSPSLPLLSPPFPSLAWFTSHS